MSTIAPGTTIVWAAPTATDNWNWINTFSSALTTVGLPKNLSVSGQIDLTTGSIAIPASPVINTIYPMGYEVRTMASSGLPTLYLRIDYQLVAASTTASGLYAVVVVTVGTTVNTSTGVVGGAATTAGASSGNTSAVMSNPASNAPRPFFMSSDGANYLTFCVDPGHAVAVPVTVPAITVLERTITASTGAYNANGYQLMSLASGLVAAGSNGSGTWNVNLSSSVCAYQSNFGVTFPGAMFTGSGTGTAATVAPVSVMLPAAQGPMLAALGYFNGDVAAGNTFPAMIYGASHTFLATGLGNLSFSQAPTTAGSTSAFGAQRLAMRYE